MVGGPCGRAGGPFIRIGPCCCCCCRIAILGCREAGGDGAGDECTWGRCGSGVCLWGILGTLGVTGIIPWGIIGVAIPMLA